MEWNCADTDKRLSDYLDKQTTVEESAALGAHLTTCAQCTDLVSRVAATVEMLGSANAIAVPPGLFEKIVAATSQPKREAQGWRRWTSPAANAWQPQFAMGAITIAASFLIVFHAANTPRGSQTFSSVNPLSWLREANRQLHLTYAHTAKFVDNLRVVYEIQTRLGNSQDDPPGVTPAEAPDSDPPVAAPQLPHSGESGGPAQPQHKSELSPRLGRETRARAVLASREQDGGLIATTRSHT